MKSKIKRRENKFPKLMQNSGGCVRIVYEDGSSAIIKSITDWATNGVSLPEDWNRNEFTDFTGSITLSND